MSGSRDLSTWDLWEDSLARSRERRRRGGQRRGGTSTLLAHERSQDAVRRARDLSDSEPWELSIGRSHARRRALELQFVPGSSRAKRLSLGTLAALSAGPAAGNLADAGAATSGSTGPATTSSHNLTLAPGSKGRGVRALQRSLGIAVDGIYGPATSHAVRAFQAGHGLAVDDVVGPQTSAAINGGGGTTRNASVVSHGTVRPASGSAVVRLQRALGVSVDGTFGPQTKHAVRLFQAKHGLTVDDVVGPATWQALGVSAQGTLHPPGAGGHGTPGSGAPTRHASHAVTRHSPGDAVVRLQRALGISADGKFGAQTKHAVRQFQASHGLAVDDVIGPATWQALGVSGEGTLHPPGAAGGSGSSGSSGGGSGNTALGVVQRVIAGGNRIANLPYRYGGGHGSFTDSGYDCSGSVSYALHAGGLLQSPQDSSGLESYGQPGPGKHITIYANSGHAYMVVDGRRFDTSGQSSSGSRWQSATRDGSGYVVRHPAGM